MRSRYWLAVLLAAPLVVSRGRCGQPQPPAVFNKVCGACHPLETVTSQRRTRPQWQESIDQMIARGAKGTPEEFAAVLDYLVRNHGPAAAAERPAAGTGAWSAGRTRGTRARLLAGSRR